MSASTIRSLTGEVRAVKAQMRATLDALRVDAQGRRTEFQDAVQLVTANIKDIRDATAELRGEVADQTNGPPSAASPRDADKRAIHFSDLHPSQRSPTSQPLK